MPLLLSRTRPAILILRSSPSCACRGPGLISSSEIVTHAMQPALPVATSPELLHALDALRAGDFVALDTEFMRESTYYPKLCLIQAATDERCVVDRSAGPLRSAPAVGLSRRPQPRQGAARRAAGSRGHVARDERRCASAVRSSIRRSPARCSDRRRRPATRALVAERLGRSLAKGHTRTDWSRRPLSAEQLQYAADDVRYLAPLYRELRDALEARRAPGLALRRDARTRTAATASRRPATRVAAAEGSRPPAA